VTDDRKLFDLTCCERQHLFAEGGWTAIDGPPTGLTQLNL
jgi:hypothetical protein